MIQKGVREDSDIVERINFKSFTTQELRDLVETLCLYPSLDNIDFDECLQAVEELNIREGIYEELEMLH